MKTNENIEKARSGVYEDTSENRRKHRVGQKYGQEASAQEEGEEKKSKRAERLERLKKYQEQYAQIASKVANAKTEEEIKLGKDLSLKVREKMEKLGARLGVDPYAGVSKVEESAQIPEEKPTKPAYDKPWPVEVDNMKQSVDYDILEAEERKAAQAKFDSLYGSPEGFIESKLQTNSYFTDQYNAASPEEKEKLKNEAVRNWINGQISDMRGGWRAKDRLSKTARINNLKQTYQGIAKRAEEARQKAEYEAYMKTDKGAARKAEYEAKKKDLYDRLDRLQEDSNRSIKSMIADAGISVISKADIDKMKPIVDGDRIRISGITNSSWEDVSVYYRSRWDEDKRDYKVNIRSFGDVEPGDQDVIKAVAISMAFLTNTNLIEEAKETIMDFHNSREKLHKEVQELNKEYADVDVK